MESAFLRMWDVPSSVIFCTSCILMLPRICCIYYFVSPFFISPRAPTTLRKYSNTLRKRCGFHWLRATTSCLGKPRSVLRFTLLPFTLSNTFLRILADLKRTYLWISSMDVSKPVVLRFSFNLSSTIPNAPTTIGITFVLTPHIFRISLARSWYFSSFSSYFALTPSIIRNCHNYNCITEIRTWWDALSTLGPDFGYFPNDRKCWIIAKPAKVESVGEAFKETSINVTVQGQKHLGAATGPREHLEEYVSKKVSSWINDIAKLAEFSLSQPQDLLETLENAISHASFLKEYSSAASSLGWPGCKKPVPWSKVRKCLVCQSNKAPCWTNCISVTSVTWRFPHKTSTTGSKKWKIKGTRTQGRAY